jgi:hypothetical protein
VNTQGRCGWRSPNALRRREWVHKNWNEVVAAGIRWIVGERRSQEKAAMGK